MPKAFLPKVATSNDLLNGDAIYFARPGWTLHLCDAAVALSEADANLMLDEAQKYPLETVEVELIDVDLSTGTPIPSRFRETLRSKGPTNYFHGKQEDHV